MTKKADIDSKEIFDKYHETFYKDLRGWRDYELTSKGYGEWYYDCLPTDKTALILDIGCGDGKFLFYLKQKGYDEIENLEISAQQAKEAKKNVRCPIHVVEDTTSFLLKNINTYKMITANDVLEHVPKIKTIKFLKALLSAIQPGGSIVINVPQISKFRSLFFKYNDFTHETIFTEMSLKQVLFTAGFSNIRFVPQKWPVKWTLREFALRFARSLWYGMLKIIYTLESPGEKHPYSFQERLVAVATRSRDSNSICSIYSFSNCV